LQSKVKVATLPPSFRTILNPIPEYISIPYRI
jgi:hypothetical protein